MLNVNKKNLVAASVPLPAVAIIGAAVAGTGGTEFAPIVTVLTDWLTGGLGQVLSLAALGIGLALGVSQQSLMAVIVGVVFAMAVFFGPGLLTGVVSVGLPF